METLSIQTLVPNHAKCTVVKNIQCTHGSVRVVFLQQNERSYGRNKYFVCVCDTLPFRQPINGIR